VTPPTDLRQYLAELPKIELHRHLEGSVRLSTMVELATQYDLDIPTRDAETLRKYVQITPDSPTDSAHFLAKFTVLRQFFVAPEVIGRLAREAVEDAAADNVKYMELRFTPKALAKIKDFSFNEVVDWVCDGVEEAQQVCDIRVKLIVSMNRHEAVYEGMRALRAALDHRQNGVVAIDLAGQETGHPANPFFDLFAQAAQEGLGITVHAGEWAGPRNIRDAIEIMNAQRIGHGVRVVEDSSIVQLARERGTVFEVCPTSNIQSGVFHTFDHHPLRDMTQLGLRTTINTDDPSISAINLTDELMLSTTRLGLTLDDVKRNIINAAQGAFLPPDDLAALVAYFKDALLPTEQPE